MTARNRLRATDRSILRIFGQRRSFGAAANAAAIVRRQGFAVVRGLINQDQACRMRGHFAAAFRSWSQLTKYIRAEPFYCREGEGPGRGAQILVYHKEANRHLDMVRGWRRLLRFRLALLHKLGEPVDLRERCANQLQSTCVLMGRGQANPLHDDGLYVASPVLCVIHLTQSGVNYGGGKFLIFPGGSSRSATKRSETMELMMGDVVFLRPHLQHGVGRVCRGRRLIVSVALPRFDESVFLSGHEERRMSSAAN
jgi:hypothetical protein